MSFDEMYILEKLNAVFLTYLAEGEVKSLILTLLDDKVRSGDIYQGRVQRLEGTRIWVDIGHAKPALLAKPHKILNVGELVCVQIERIPLGQKGAQVTQTSSKIAESFSKVGQIHVAPEEWLSYLMKQENSLKIVTNTERVFRHVRALNTLHHITLKSDLKVPDKISMAWQSLLEPAVQIPGGGWIFIEEGETLTAIDVNTGGGEFISPDLKDDRAWLKFNQRAADVIQDQLQLRQIGGLIVIDFPRLQEKKNQHVLYDTMIKFNVSRSQVLGFTRAGLFEITREKKCNSLPRRLQEIIGKNDEFSF
ncbi:ribonuclease E [Caedimonas varicaedens]|uniref:Ribonuclease E n=1 Tax=Caedimonas varicaedens TaxID=1629334 RepID=A0A0K8MC04_9PROT|nr:ribonuclease E [Caedimonas varicaedens]